MIFFTKMLKIIFIYFIINISCFQKYFVSAGGIQKSDLESVVECILKVYQRDLKFRSAIILKCEQSENGNLFFNEIIQGSNVNFIPRIILEDINEFDTKNNLEGVNWLIALHFNTCEKILEINLKTMDDKLKYLIYVTDSIENCRITLIHISDYVGKYDVTFIFKSTKGSHKMFTFIPQIIAATCKEVIGEPVEIKSCENGQTKNTTAFPNKNPTNLRRCLFNVGMGPLFPFCIVKGKDKLKTFDPIDENRVRGSDLQIIKIITNELNGTLNLHYISKREENPIGQYEFLPYIMNGSLDACAGGFYRLYGDTVSYSGIYARQTVSWMYTVDRRNRSWQNLVQKVHGLYVFIIFYFCYSFIWYVLCKFDKQTVSMKTTLLLSWGALVGAASLQDPRSVKQKILNLTYLLMCIYFSTYISVQFYSFLTILEPPEIFKSNEDIMLSGRIPYLVSEAKYFVFDEKYVAFANTSKECVSFLDCSKKTLVHKGITLLLQAGFLNFQARTAVEDEAKVLRATDNFVTVYYEMLIRKRSWYVAKIQDIIKRLFEAGIPEKLFLEAIGLSVVGKAKSASDNIITNSYSCQSGCKITLDQLAGAFYIWLFGCALSLCSFTLEIVSRNGGRTDHTF